MFSHFAILDGAREFKHVFKAAAQAAVHISREEMQYKDLGELKYRYVPAVFYCEWAGLEHGHELSKKDKEKIKQFYPACCFSHFFGMPTLKFKDENGVITESEPIEYNSYQKRWIANVVKYRFYSMLKCRGAGATEILTIRWRLYRAIVNHIPNRKFCIIAGTHQALAVEFLRRMKVLCDRRPFVYRIIPKTESPSILHIGVSKIMALPAESEVVRGLENVEDIDLEEPASWDLQNDQPVLDAAEPHVTKSGATLQIKGTPRGRRGFFWEKIWNPEIKTKYYRERTLVDEVLDAEHPLLDRAEVERIKQTDPRTYRQEFMGEFVLPEDSLYGQLDPQKNISDDFGALEL